MKKLFTIGGDIDKRIMMVTPSSELRVEVDNDDVDASESLPLLERMLTILNDHWNDPKYAALRPLTRDDDDEDGERVYEAAKKYKDNLIKKWSMG